MPVEVVCDCSAVHVSRLMVQGQQLLLAHEQPGQCCRCCFDNFSQALLCESLRTMTTAPLCSYFLQA